MNKFETIPLKALIVAPENARKDSPPDDEIKALADRIAIDGLQQPLSGYRRGKTHIAVYDARRRLLALRMLAQPR
ncbi:MAG: ParB N-terminal domain-containing protein, partial [Pseudomonadota bacterium]